ncbi:MAG: LytTR family DNA-binding domain-containing protein [Leeuwenhoekiella sp.]
MKAIIVEDEIHAQNAIKRLLKNYAGTIEVVQICTSVCTAITAIKDHEPDLVFLDVNILGGTCFDILEKVDYSLFYSVFTTAYNEYAVKAFDFSACDYLIKPIEASRLDRALTKIEMLADAQRTIEVLQHNYREKLDRIAFSTTAGYEVFNISEIICFEANGAYTKVFFEKNKPIMVSKNLGYYFKLLAHSNFFRTHKSSMINLNHVQKVYAGKNVIALLKGNHKVQVSARQSKELRELLKSQS